MQPAKPHAHEVFQPIISIDRILHEPARLAIMALLYSMKEADFGFLKSYIGLSQGNLSSHLRRLERAGYIIVERGFVTRYPTTLARITDKGIANYQKYRRCLSHFLNDFE